MSHWRIKWLGFRRGLADWAWAVLSPEPSRSQIRPINGVVVIRGRCEDTDEVCGFGFLHVEQMDDRCFWARLSTPPGQDDVVMRWNVEWGRLRLTAEYD